MAGCRQSSTIKASKLETHTSNTKLTDDLGTKIE